MELTQETKQAFDVSLSVAANMQKLQITDDKGYLMVAEGIKTIKREYKKQEGIRVALVKPLNDHVKFINNQFKPVMGELSRAEDVLKNKVAAYNAELEKKRKEAERIAREKADAERRKKEEAARIQREKEEKERKAAEELKRKAEAEADAKKKADLLKQSKREEIKADNAGNQALVYESMAEQIKEPIIKQEPAAKGVSFVTTYSAVVEDKAAFIRQCVERGQFEYLEIKIALLTKEANQTKGARSWAGVKVVSGTSTKVRV